MAVAIVEFVRVNAETLAIGGYDQSLGNVHVGVRVARDFLTKPA